MALAADRLRAVEQASEALTSDLGAALERYEANLQAEGDEREHSALAVARAIRTRVDSLGAEVSEITGILVRARRALQAAEDEQQTLPLPGSPQRSAARAGTGEPAGAAGGRSDPKPPAAPTEARPAAETASPVGAGDLGGDVVPEGVRVLVTQMTFDGASNRAIAARLQDQFGIRSADAVVAAVLGSAEDDEYGLEGYEPPPRFLDRYETEEPAAGPERRMEDDRSEAPDEEEPQASRPRQRERRRASRPRRRRKRTSPRPNGVSPAPGGPGEGEELVPEEAHVRASQMLVAGSGREEIAARLRDEFGLVDADAVVTAALRRR